MINFGDLAPIANIKVTEPIAQAKEASAKMFTQSLRDIETNISAENAAYKQVFEEIMKTGKVQFGGGSAEAFKEKYKTEKESLLNEMKKFSSVQSFLNSGGYEKIAAFKDNIERSEEFANGVKSAANEKIVQELLAKGVLMEDIKTNYQDWVKGSAKSLDFGGTYNLTPVKLESFMAKDKAEKASYYDDETLRTQMELQGFSEAKIKQALKLNQQERDAGQGGFIRQAEDESYALRRAQQKAFEAQAAASNATKEEVAKIAANAKIEAARIKAQADKQKKLKQDFEVELNKKLKSNFNRLDLEKEYNFKSPIIDKDNFVKQGEYTLTSKEKIDIEDKKYVKAGPPIYSATAGTITQKVKKGTEERIIIIKDGFKQNSNGKNTLINAALQSYLQDKSTENVFIDENTDRENVSPEDLNP